MQQKLIIIVVALIAFYACTKKSTTPNTTTTVNNDTTIVQQVKWVKPTFYITYKADGVTEATRAEYVYDNEGRVTNYKSYNNGQLLLEYRDYVYSGNEYTCYQDQYSGGALIATTKMKAGFLNN